MRIGEVTVDLGTGSSSGAVGGSPGEPVHLTPTEWHLLEVLVRHPGKLLSQRQLLTEVWGSAYVNQPANLRLYMAQLRHKLEPDPTRPRYLLTEPGLGYCFRPERAAGSGRGRAGDDDAVAGAHDPGTTTRAHRPRRRRGLPCSPLTKRIASTPKRATNLAQPVCGSSVTTMTGRPASPTPSESPKVRVEPAGGGWRGTGRGRGRAGPRRAVRVRGPGRGTRPSGGS